ncbi:putative ribonuclease H-like domain-containing protein [Tanacetum coccineum]
MRNKDGKDVLDIDDLYNNLKVFEADIKGSFGSSLNSQNVAFLSAEDTSSSNEVNTANSVSTASSHNSQGQASSSSYIDDLMFSFFANQSNSPKLDDEDLEQIDHDDWRIWTLNAQVAMLFMRVKQFYKKTRRKLIFNGKEPVGFDKAKVECFNCHSRGHFTRKCRAPRNQGNRNGDTGYRRRYNTKRTIPMETSDALVVQDNALIGLDIECWLGKWVTAVKASSRENPQTSFNDKGIIGQCMFQALTGEMNEFCGLKGIKREFSVARTPQQNGVAERKEHDLIVAARTMLADSLLLLYFWAESSYILFYKSLDEKYKNNTADDAASETPVQKPASENEQALKNVLDKMELLSREILEPDSNNSYYFCLAQPSAPRTFNDAGPSFVPLDVNDPLDDPLMPDLEDTAKDQKLAQALNDDKLGLKQCKKSCLVYDSKRIEAIRLFLAYASFMSFLVYQMDVKSAFLYSTIEEEVYVSQPPGFVDPKFPKKVTRCQIDKTLFIKRVNDDILLVQVYVDDIIFGSTKKSLCIDFEQIMHKRFQMSSMGELTFFLGLQVKQKEDGLFISQYKYVGVILKKFVFSSIRTTSTPMETNKALTKDKAGEDVDINLYKLMIGSLMYLTSSRPDIMFSICACSRFQVQPKVSHLNAVKRIFRYLKGQPKLGLWYPKDSLFILEAFSDSDYAGASLDRKSTTRGCQFLGSRFQFLIASIGLELQGYLINDGYADLVRMLVTLLILLMFHMIGLHHIINGHQFTMSNRQERMGYSRANSNW